MPIQRVIFHHFSEKDFFLWKRKVANENKIPHFRQQDDEVVEENQPYAGAPPPPPQELTEFVDPPLDDWPALNFKFIDQVESDENLNVCNFLIQLNYF